MFNLEGTHEYYTRRHTHWSPNSQRFTGGDALLSALRSGWTLNGRVFRDSVMMSGARFTTIYYFELQRGAEAVTMPVISNPWVVRFVAEQDIQVINQPGEFADMINIEAEIAEQLLA